MAGPCIADTDCISLSQDEDGNLQADLILDDNINNLADCGADGLLVRTPSAAPRATIQRTVQQLAIPSGVNCTTTYTPLAYQTTIEDVGGMADLANDRLVVPAGGGGVYVITLQDRDNPTVNGFWSTGPIREAVTIGVRLLVNGDLVAENRVSRVWYQSHFLTCTRTMLLAAGDIIEAEWSLHTSTAPIVNHILEYDLPITDVNSFLQATRVGLT
jgi:hypothetical protein